MAEFIEQKIQEMVPEMEEMERLGLLTSEEIKKLIQRRRDFEYKVYKNKKEKQDFINYVLFDIKLLELINIRRKKNMIFKKLNKIDNTIRLRVMRKLKMMTRMWPSHSDIWKLRISFLKSVNFLEEVSTSYSEQIRYHGNDENVWVAWAQWEIEGRKNFDKARSILLSRAPLYHPLSLIITTEYFRLELMYIEFLTRRSKESNVEGLEEIIEENREKVLNCAVSEAVYSNAMKEFDTAELFLRFYTATLKFQFASQLREKIYCDLVKLFPNDANVWKLKAKMLIEGIGTDHETSLKTSDDSDEGSVSPKTKLKDLCELYDEALLAIGSSFVKCIIEDLFHLLNKAWGSEEFVDIIKEKLFQVFKQNYSRLTAVESLYWFEFAKQMEASEKDLEEILQLSSSVHPDCMHLKLHSLPLTFPKEDLKSQIEIINSLSGKIGAKICEKLIDHTTTGKGKITLVKRACNHTDAIISKQLRLKRLEEFKGLKISQKFYNKYKSLPPYCIQLHVSMLKKELKQEHVSLTHVRKVFDEAVQQFGQVQTGLWLCYIEFERKFGDMKKVSFLKDEAQRILKSTLVPTFIDQKILIESTLLIQDQKDSKMILIDCPKIVDDESSKDNIWNRSTLPPLFEMKIIDNSSAEENRKRFFASLTKIEEDLEVELSSKQEEVNRKGWEEILSLIHGRNVSLEVKIVNMKAFGIDQEVENYVTEADEKFHEKITKGSETLSDGLHHQSIDRKSSMNVTTEIQKILQTSDTLKADFLNQKQIIPYYLNKKKLKSIRKKERLQDAGKGWFNMKAPEMTEEVQRDLKILKMRSILDPKTHYKRNDMKQLPKFFQMGKVVDSPLDFYSSRIPKKERKRTMAEAIMGDEAVLRYQKRKYSEIVEKREVKRSKVKKAKMDAKSKKKSSSKSKKEKSSKFA